VDIVDVDAATAKGIWVTNVPSYCEEEVADHAAALILASVRKLAEYQESVRQGEWSWRAGRPITSLCQAVFGLVGFGKIGRLVWRRMKAFGCQGLVYSPHVDPDEIREHGGNPVSLEELLTRADIVHIQCPLRPETFHLIDEKAISLMKPGAIITNAARGPIIDENALIKALREKRIAGAGLDDIEHEPAKVKDWHPSQNPLINMPNVIVTPHTAWYSEQATEKVKRVSASEVARVLSGESPMFPVNQVNR
jgi:D-3-phosphoglycerate dehydrogenase